MESNISIVLPLDNIDELFNAPDVNPFSTREVDLLGQAAMDCIEKRVTRYWPRKPSALHVTLQLPADQMTPGLVDDTRTAVRRYCANHIEGNRVHRQVVIRRALRQLAYAGLGSLVAFAIIALLWNSPLGLIPDSLRGVLIVLSALAVSVLLFDAVWAVAFDWIPFVQDNTVHTILMDMDLAIEPQGKS
ncbi:MAG: hypothetical protein ACM3XO_28750 [Bacteroidota bacterium]